MLIITIAFMGSLGRKCIISFLLASYFLLAHLPCIHSRQSSPLHCSLHPSHPPPSWKWVSTPSYLKLVLSCVVNGNIKSVHSGSCLQPLWIPTSSPTIRGVKGGFWRSCRVIRCFPCFHKLWDFFIVFFLIFFFWGGAPTITPLVLLVVVILS